jgi:hypothetical protein
MIRECRKPGFEESRQSLNYKKMKSTILSFITAILCLHSIAQISTSPDDRKNPYDYIGSNHNSALDFIIQKYPRMSGQFFNENWKAITSEFLTSKQFDTRNFLNVFSNLKVDQKCGIFSFYTDKMAEEELKKYFNSGLISRVKYEKANEVYNLVNEVDALLAESGGDAAKTYSVFYNKMLKLESFYQLMGADDQSFCYMIASLANHSVWYWLNEGSKSQSVWGVPKCSSAGMKFSWGRLGASDVGGAVAGAVRFGVAAALGGPTGLAACGVAALAGGVGASAGYAILSLFGF